MLSLALCAISTEQQGSAVEEFYLSARGKLYNIAFSILHNCTLAEEVVQDTFVKIIDNPERFLAIPSDKRQAYANVIARNRSLDVLKKSQNHPISDIDDCGDEASESFTAEEMAVGKILFDDLAEFIRTLPESRKSALVLRILHNMTIAEIADTLDISESAVKSRISRAEHQIKHYIERRDNGQ